AGPIIGRVVGVPTPKDAVFEAGEELFRRLQHLHDILTDPARSSVRLVLNLEKMVIKEAQRTFTYFHLFGYPSDLVVVNRVLPADLAGDGSFGGLRRTQQGYLPVIEAQFAPVPVRTVPQFDREMIGSENLIAIGQELFGDSDPT